MITPPSIRLGPYSAVDVVSVKDQPANGPMTKIPHLLCSVGVENFPVGGGGRLRRC